MLANFLNITTDMMYPLLAATGAISVMAVVFGRRFFLDGIFNNGLSKECLDNDLSGFYAIVTGANRGIGYEITKSLIQRGCNVVLACRNANRAKQAIHSITRHVTSNPSTIKPGKMRFIEISLDNLHSVQQFVTNYQSLNIPLHFLIHNAAYQTVKYEFTSDKFETCWQINYLSPFYLTHHLLPLIHASVRANPTQFYGRIVSVTSKGHIHCTEIPYHHFKNTDSLLNNQVKMNEIAATFNGIEGEYHNTKMGQVLHAIRLQQILNEKVNTNNAIKIDICSVHPGLVNTDIFKWHEKPWYVQIFITLLTPFFLLVARSAEQAAECVLHCALVDRKHPTFAGGSYHSNCRTVTPGYGAKETTKLIASDLNKLYDQTLDVLQLKSLQFGL
eukprot:197372_1